MSNAIVAISLDHINMQVKNLEQSISFYKNMFGFTVRKEDNSTNSGVPSQIIGNDAIKLCLYEHPEMSPEGGIVHFGFHVKNYDDILSKCKKHKVQVLYGGPVKFEKSESVYIKDPNGYDIELSKICGGGL